MKRWKLDLCFLVPDGFFLQGSRCSGQNILSFWGTPHPLGHQPAHSAFQRDQGLSTPPCFAPAAWLEAASIHCGSLTGPSSSTPARQCQAPRPRGTSCQDPSPPTPPGPAPAAPHLSVCHSGHVSMLPDPRALARTPDGSPSSRSHLLASDLSLKSQWRHPLIPLFSCPHWPQYLAGVIITEFLETSRPYLTSFHLVCWTAAP